MRIHSQHHQQAQPHHTISFGTFWMITSYSVPTVMMIPPSLYSLRQSLMQALLLIICSMSCSHFVAYLIPIHQSQFGTSWPKKSLAAIKLQYYHHRKFHTQNLVASTEASVVQKLRYPKQRTRTQQDQARICVNSRHMKESLTLTI